MSEKEAEKAVRTPAGREEGPPEEPARSEEILKLRAENQELIETLQRRQADFENYRKRVEKERQQERHRGIESLIVHLLPVLDDFERALAAHADPAYEEYRKGVAMIERRLWTVLEKQGVLRIESVGKPFDPHLHHAIDEVETSEFPAGTVASELQAGYVLQGSVLRPAMVRVAKGPATEDFPDAERKRERRA